MAEWHFSRPEGYWPEGFPGPKVDLYIYDFKCSYRSAVRTEDVRPIPIWDGMEFWGTIDFSYLLLAEDRYDVTVGFYLHTEWGDQYSWEIVKLFRGQPGDIWRTLVDTKRAKLIAPGLAQGRKIDTKAEMWFSAAPLPSIYLPRSYLIGSDPDADVYVNIAVLFDISKPESIYR